MFDYNLQNKVIKLQESLQYLYCLVKKLNSDSEKSQNKEFFDNFSGSSITLSNTPLTGTIVNVIENGLTLREGINRDYTRSGNVISFNIARSNINVEINYIL